MEDIEATILEHKNNIKKLNEQLTSLKDKNELTILNIQIKAEQDIIFALLELLNKNKNNNKYEIKTNLEKENVEENELMNDRTENKIIKEIYGEEGEVPENKKKKQKKKNIKINNTNNIDLEQLNKIDPNIDKNFNYYYKDEDIYVKYYINKRNENNIYYYCSKKRNGCPGSIKYNKDNKEWILLYKCDTKIIHDTNNFEVFYQDYLENNLNKYNMQYIKYQKYYIRSLYKSNENMDISNIKSMFKNKFNLKLTISKEEIYKEKYNVFGDINKMSIETLCDKISDNNIKVNNKTIDIFYDYNEKNKIIKREERVIILTTETMEKNLKDPNISNFFIDVTYRIIPLHNKNKYKMMTITGTNDENYNTYICALILLKYEDTQSFSKIFKYLNEMYCFNPHIVHIDYSSSLTKALSIENIFNNKPIIVHCFFHFIQSIVKRMKKLNMIKTKLTKHAFEVLKNIEIVCFIPKTFIKSYIKFLENHLTSDKEKLLNDYIKNNWFNKTYSYYNYYELFLLQGNNEIISHFYFTNNIAESLHNKLNLYLPNKKITNSNFILSIRNVILNYEIIKDNILRKDYVTKTLLEYVKDIKKNDYEWLTYEKFKTLEKEVIKKCNNSLDIDVIEELINSLNDLHVDKIENNEIIDKENSEQMDISIIDEESEDDKEIEDVADNTDKNEVDDESLANFNILNLYDRLLNDKKFLNYKDLIRDLKKRKNYKRSEIENDDDIKNAPKITNKKVKMRYPKNK